MPTMEQAKAEAEARIQVAEAEVVKAEAAEKIAVQAADAARSALASALQQAAHQGFRLGRFDYETENRKSVAQTNRATE